MKDESFSLSCGQKSLWLQNQHDKTIKFNNLSFAAEILSELDIPKLEYAIEAILQKYDSLHTQYIETHGIVKQKVIKPNRQNHFEIRNVKDKTKNEIICLLNKDADEAFDLDTGILMKAKLYESNNNKYIFFMGFHHIAVDLWSMTQLVHDLGRAYNCEDIMSEDTSKINNYREFVEYQKCLLDSEKGEKLYNYWKNYLTFMLSVAYWLFYKYSGQSIITLGTPFSGRGSSKFKKTFGFFVNPLIMCQEVRENQSFTDFLKISEKHYFAFSKPSTFIRK